MRRAELLRLLQHLAPFDRPKANLEQAQTPPERALELLEEAQHRGDLEGRTVADLGTGTGVLAIGAALLGASTLGVDADPAAIEVARANAERAGVEIEFDVADVSEWGHPVDTIVMNPPFGAQTKHADRPFWDAALEHANSAVYAFALAASRIFIERRAVARSAQIEVTRPVRWELPRTFPHHRRRSVALSVDLWVLRRERTE